MSYFPPGYYPPGYFPQGYFPGFGDELPPSSDLNWEADDATWGGTQLSYGEVKPIMLKGKDFYQADASAHFDSEPIRVVLERTGFTTFGRDRNGEPKSDPRVIKLLTEVWPVFFGFPGTVIDFYAGSQVTPQSAVVWQGPFSFTFGVSRVLQPLISTTYLALKFESVGQPPWSLISLDLDITPVGVTPR